ncbi:MULTISPECIES: hypothetical protein [Streptomyces]|uniref:hypothetical protein n=1 Tax=Streptomyces TaxID=1883 RepID=UPI000F54C94B|nr:hypothetical protein [Streptomyces sp. ADI97-07]RPK78800.1 hypothetical protein EES45_17150 [Streptomyces sp. ADI97-07]WRY83153.1 hypothetical protein OG388_18940 [Streptomyces clavifer]
MAQHSPAPPRLCPDCNGFPVVAIDTGTLLDTGTRAILLVACRLCRGTGSPRTATPAPVVQREHA